MANTHRGLLFVFVFLSVCAMEMALLSSGVRVTYRDMIKPRPVCPNYVLLSRNVASIGERQQLSLPYCRTYRSRTGCSTVLQDFRL